MPDWVHAKLQMPVHALLDEVMRSRPAEEPIMKKVMPFPSSDRTSSPYGLNVPSTSTYWVLPQPPSSSAPTPEARKTYLMATLNTTPDSFSDGAQHASLPAALAHAAASVAAGADIIDIGGYSTRPRAAFVSAADETQRVVPVIRAVRAAAGALRRVPLSVDTFRAEVARAAVLAGANCINDVCAFAGPAYPPSAESAVQFAGMRAAARELAVPVVMMHSRGDAAANKDYASYAAAPDAGGGAGVIEGVRVELGEKVQRAVRGKGGIRRWLVMVDPGVGFSKTLEGNLEILRHASELTADVPLHNSVSSNPVTPYASAWRNPLVGFPLLIGASRKSFLGVLLSQPSPPANPDASSDVHPGRDTSPKERVYATASAVSCAVQQGAAVVRVHDVEEMADVIRVASALWR